jgi:RNA-directed DNA polymerase
VNHQPTDREEKAPCSTSSLHISEESDHAIVPVNLSNNGEPSPAEIGEGSAGTKENAGPSSTHPTQSGVRVSQGLAGVRHSTPRIRSKSRMR